MNLSSGNEHSEKTRRINFNNRIMNNTLMLFADNANFQSDAREKRMKIVDENIVSSIRIGRVSMATRWICSKISVERFCWPIQENWRYSSLYREHSSNQRCENAPFHLWFTTATILVYRILIIEYRRGTKKEKKANVNRQILVDFSFYSHRFWNCF